MADRSRMSISEMILWVLLVAWCVCTLAGCVSVKYDPEKGVSYSRIGSQEIQGFSATRLDDGTVEVRFEQQKSDAAQLVQAAVKGAVEGLK